MSTGLRCLFSLSPSRFRGSPAFAPYPAKPFNGISLKHAHFLWFTPTNTNLRLEPTAAIRLVVTASALGSSEPAPSSLITQLDDD